MFKKGDKPWNTGLTKETDERVRKIAEMKIGKKRSPETIRKMSEAMRGENNPNYGKHHSIETRRRISEGKLKEDPENLREIFTEDRKQVFFGSVFGDGSLRNGNAINFYFEEGHSIKQKDYLEWKIKFLKIFNAKLKKRVSKNYKLNRSYKQIFLKTSCFPTLTKFYNIFYPNNKKTIPIDVLNQLNELGLAVWYLDDGHVTTPESLITLSTDGYTYKENTLIQKFFKEKWNICPKIGKRNGKYHYLLFNARDSKKLLSIFKRVFEEHNVPESMFYKLGELWEGNKEKIKKARLKKNAYKKRWRAKRRKEGEKKKLKELKSKGKMIRKLYWSDGLNSREVGEIMGYSSGGIRKIMKKLNIPIRSPSEAHSGERNGFYGKHHTKESRIKMSKNRWGKRSKLK
jgi:hypothetical protein